MVNNSESNQSAAKSQKQNGQHQNDQQQNCEQENGQQQPKNCEQQCQKTEDKTKELIKVLEKHEVFELEGELDHRKEILQKLNSMLQKWIVEVAISKNMSEEAAQKLGGKIYTFGSYGLGVHQKGADIDALCVAPRNIERSDYFTSFLELLRIQPEITECRAVEEAFVPVIKMKYDGIEIDLLFARLALKEIPEDFNLHDDNLLKNLDVYSVRSVNGFRVTDAILNLVPNIENFRLALRTIKLWAKKAGIYSNALGYFGGVTWAMLVAKTCQLYPNAAVSTLIHKFFLVFSQWQWPEPVLLKCPENIDLGFPVWDPRINVSDRYHLMPIITPAYPQQNSTFNVSESTKNVMLSEFERGMAITEEIMFGNATWDRLFREPNFFYRYRHFLVLLANSENTVDHLAWCGLVESKVRILVKNIERHQHIKLAHINRKCFKLKTKVDNGTSSDNITASATDSNSPTTISSMWFIGLEFQRNENLNVDLCHSILNFTGQVYTHAENIQILKDGMTIEVRHVKRNQLNQYLDKNLLKRERRLSSEENHNNYNIGASSKHSLAPEIQYKWGEPKRRRISESLDENNYINNNYKRININNNRKYNSTLFVSRYKLTRYNLPSTAS